MISIRRGICPSVLADAPVDGIHYNKKAVVEALHLMQNGKCCYCEAFIPDEGHGKAVEHFHPKSVYKHQKNDWINLLLACDHCNGSKSDLFPVRLSDIEGGVTVIYKPLTTDGSPLMIDPSEHGIDPEDHITFVVDLRKENAMHGLPVAKNGSQKGQATIETVRLDASYLLRVRQQLLYTLSGMMIVLHEAKAVSDTDKIQTYKALFESRMAHKSPYAGFVRAFCRHYGLDKQFQLRVPRGID